MGEILLRWACPTTVNKSFKRIMNSQGTEFLNICENKVLSNNSEFKVSVKTFMKKGKPVEEIRRVHVYGDN